MNYADIKKYDVANGPGVRISLFVSGCTHHCKGCFNSETWDFNYGKPFTQAEIDSIIDYMSPDFIKGLTLLGGEPFEPSNQEGLIHLLRKVREVYPDKNIWCYTGYNFVDDIMTNMYNTLPYTKEMVSYIDVIVDGEFVLEQKKVGLRFKGSQNQRIICVNEYLKSGEIVLWDEINPLEKY